MRTRSSSLALLALVAIASPGCGGPEEGSAGPSVPLERHLQPPTAETSPVAPPEDIDERAPAPRAAEPAFYSAEGAPEDPLACATKEDCVASGTVDEGGCCFTYRHMNAVAMSHEYREWLSEYRRASCADVDCPPPPAPSRPPSCLFDLVCSDGQCGNTCPSSP